MSTNKKRKYNGGWGVYIAFILGFIFLWYMSTNSTTVTTITKAEFEQALLGKTVAEVTVVQNAEVPTAFVVLKEELKDCTFEFVCPALSKPFQATLQGFPPSQFYPHKQQLHV